MDVPRSKAFLDGLAAAIAGMTPENQAAVRALAEDNKQWRARAEHYERTARELAGEVHELRERLTTQADALASVRAALAPWEELLGAT